MYCGVSRVSSYMYSGVSRYCGILNSPHAFTSLVSVRRALRMRKNYVKLSMYNHFAYTLIFAILAALAFTVWMFVEVNFPKNGCLEVRTVCVCVEVLIGGERGDPGFIPP